MAGCSLARVVLPMSLRNLYRHIRSYCDLLCEYNCCREALTDIVVTSTNAKQVVETLQKMKRSFSVPIKTWETISTSLPVENMLLWDGVCHVHAQFSLERILALKKEYPGALLLAHPECPKYLLEVADHVGSTSSILKFATESDKKQFIVATEAGYCIRCKKKTPINCLFGTT